MGITGESGPTYRLPAVFEIEHPFDCPYCGAPITMMLDPSVTAQAYVEDCEVCCNPIAVRYEIESDEVVLFEGRSIEQ
jgi:hypothetical protein